MSPHSISCPPVGMGLIPHTMRDVAAWGGWRYEQRANKPTKVGIAPRTGRHASSTDPDAWATFDVAVAARERYRLDGLAFRIAPPFVGVDLDHCIDRETGTVAPWAAAIVALLGSYTEKSPSGTGLHIIARGALPPGRRRKGPVEMYDGGRYFTVTGDHLAGTSATVEERTDALHTLHGQTFGDERSVQGAAPHVWAIPDAPPRDLRERAARGRIRRETLGLLDSAGPDRYNSPSEADAALAAGLISAGLTADETLALLLDSPRGQDAARRKGERHAMDYWRRTVGHACDYVGPVVAHGGQRGRVMPTIARPSGVRLDPVARPAGVLLTREGSL